MKHVALALVVAAFSSTAFAAANCEKHPKDQWMSETDAKAKLTEQGYQIRKFKVDGNCYEIYGTNKEGQKVEIYFDTKSLAVVKSEIRK